MLHRLAPAKLNLFLHITGKRADGYHLLQSLAVFADIGDDVSVVPQEELTLSIEGAFADELAPDARDNLVLKAAQYLRRATGAGQGAHIRLTKRLPVGAGPGGGSSDAAAALRLLEELWHVQVDADMRQAIALQLGSDVPACLLGQACWLSGTGETLAKASLPQGLWTVLVNPRKPLLTAQVYGAFQPPFDSAIALPFAWPERQAFLAWLRDRRNALEGAAIGLMPEIHEMLKALAATPYCLLARMSGSGATCFGLYAGASEAQAAAAQLRRSFEGYWITVGALQGVS